MRQLTTDNRQPITRKKAFTLMEILISTAIFATVMVMAVGIFGQSSSYRGKITTMRAVSEDSKRLADMITRDIRTASVSVDVTAGNPTVKKTFKGGVALLQCDTTCDFAYPYSYSVEAFSGLANMLIIVNKDSYIVYVQSGAFLYRSSTQYTAPPSIDMLAAYNSTTAPANVISSSDLDTPVSFAGYAPDSTSVILQQPYIQFDIISKTKNYDTLAPNARAQMEIRSSVTARSFAD